jgi:hypothetical protein
MRALVPSVHNLACTNQVPSMSLMAREKTQNPGGSDLENYHSAGNGQRVPPMERKRRGHRTACSPSQALAWLSSRDVVPKGE